MFIFHRPITLSLALLHLCFMSSLGVSCSLSECISVSSGALPPKCHCTNTKHQVHKLTAPNWNVKYISIHENPRVFIWKANRMEKRTYSYEVRVKRFMRDSWALEVKENSNERNSFQAQQHQSEQQHCSAWATAKSSDNDFICRQFSSWELWKLFANNDNGALNGRENWWVQRDMRCVFPCSLSPNIIAE